MTVGLDPLRFVPENLIAKVPFSARGSYNVATFCHRTAAFLSQKSLHSAKPRYAIHKRIMEPFTPAFYMCVLSVSTHLFDQAGRHKSPAAKVAFASTLSCLCMHFCASVYSAASARAGTRKIARAPVVLSERTPFNRPS